MPAQQIQITASLLDGAGSPVSTATPTWSSDAEAVVRVTADGVATGVGAGNYALNMALVFSVSAIGLWLWLSDLLLRDEPSHQ